MDSPIGQEGHLASVSINEKSAGRLGSKILKKIKSEWRRCFRFKSRKNVQLTKEQDLDETAGTSGSPCPEEMFPTASMGSREDIRVAEKVDLSLDPYGIGC